MSEANTFPPYLPEGWVQAMPFLIQKRTKDDGIGVRVAPQVVSLDQPWEYTVQIWVYHSLGITTYLDAEGQRHRSRPMYKLLYPPTFKSFGEAVAAAEAFLEDPIPPAVREYRRGFEEGLAGRDPAGSRTTSYKAGWADGDWQRKSEESSYEPPAEDER